MRLTLRTLLAYLDDVLDPEQTRDIGAKLESSQNAKSLMNRIKEVIRKRRLLAPDVEQSQTNLDVNAIAQYLDNTLPPDQIAAVELQALNSDEVLAEVASCHQILTLVLGNPVHISDESRSHFYHLVESKLPHPPVGAPPQPTPPPTKPVPEPPVIDEPVGAGSGFFRTAEFLGQPIDDAGPEVPDYLRKSSRRSSILNTFVIVGVLLLWLAVTFSDSAMNFLSYPQASSTGSSVADNKAIPPANFGEKPKNFSEQLAPEVASASSPVSSPSMTTTTQSTSSPITSTELVASLPPTTQPQLSTTTSPIDSTSLAMATPDLPSSTTNPLPTTMVPSESNMVDDQTPIITEPLEEPLDPTRNRFTFVSPDDILLGYTLDQQTRQWQSLPTGTVLGRGNLIAVPRPFRCQLVTPDPYIGLTLDGSTLISLATPADSTAMTFNIIQGRIILTYKETNLEESSPKPITIGIKVRNDLWKLQLNTPGTICGFEVVPRMPEGFEQDFGKDDYFCRVIHKQGTVQIFNSDELKTILESGDAILKRWNNNSIPNLTKSVGNDMGLVNSQGWIDENLDRRTSTMRSDAIKYYKVFQPGVNLTQYLPAIAMDRETRKSEYATLTLGLVRNIHELVNILANGVNAEARQHAIDALRFWINDKLDNRIELKSELANYFSEPDAELVYRYLWGISQQDAENPITSGQLVNLLNHEHVALRHLAIYHLRNLTGRDYEFQAELPATLRQRAIARWLEHLSKEGAILPPPKP